MKSTRRRFLRQAADTLLAGPVLLAGTGGLARNAYGETFSPDRWKGRVAEVHDPAYDSFTADPESMLNRGVSRLVEADTPREAWRRLFRSDDVVAVKVNSLGGRNLSPGYPLVRAIVRGLGLAGVPENQVIVWDRSSRELQRAGYPVNTSGPGVRIFGTDALQNGYESEIDHAMTVGSCFSRILTRYCTAVVNVGVLKDHDMAGISVLLKNFYGAIHNPNKYHDNNCSPYVAHLNTYRSIRQKVRLHVVDAPNGQYHGGPAFRSSRTWPFHGLILALDSVAADRIALGHIERQRKQAGLKSLAVEKRYPAWLDIAAQLGLGEGDPASIRVMS
jgi:hypothetical protein